MNGNILETQFIGSLRNPYTNSDSAANIKVSGLIYEVAPPIVSALKSGKGAIGRVVNLVYASLGGTGSPESIGLLSWEDIEILEEAASRNIPEGSKDALTLVTGILHLDPLSDEAIRAIKAMSFIRSI